MLYRAANMAGALKGMVAEQIADHFDAYTACEQPHGKRMRRE